MRVCTVKSTGRIIESQSGGEGDGHLDALRANAIAAGYGAEEIEVSYMDDGEFAVALASQVRADLGYAEKRRVEYPPIEDYLDARVKQMSSDPEVVAEGAAQEAAYCAACLAVKALYPKPG